jgi:hypothetical protein
MYRLMGVIDSVNLLDAPIYLSFWRSVSKTILSSMYLYGFQTCDIFNAVTAGEDFERDVSGGGTDGLNCYF